jgi:DNA-binding beta-propeller fold protein YncE
MLQSDGSRTRVGIAGIALLVFFLGPALSSRAAIRIKVTTDAAPLKVSPDAGANILVRLPLATILQAEAKEGEWYKVLFEITPGNRVVAYLHELLAVPVEEPGAPPDKSVPEGEKPAPAKEAPPKEIPAKEAPAKDAADAADRAQAELTAEIEVQLDRCRALIRQGGGADEALNILSPLAARTLRVVDHARQQQITTEVFFLKGLAYASKNDDVSARKEFRNMFEVSDAEARKLAKNIFDARIAALLKLAEGEFMGLVTDYTVEIVSDPPGAKVKADGRDLGAAPAVYKTQTPKVLIELEKDGYKPIREDADLLQPSTRKSYRLAPAFFNLSVRSSPPGAKIFLDGKDTGSVTNGELFRLPAGPHQIRLVKEFYADAQAPLELQEGAGAPNGIDVALVVASYAPHGVWGGLGSPFFKNPAAIAADREGHIIVIDESPVKLKIFNRLGEVTGGGGQIALGLSGLVKPAGVASGPAAIYVADSESHVILRLDPAGGVQARWGKFGSDQDGLNTPMGLAVDGEGNLFVADTGNGRVKKYGPGGDILAIWGKPGSENGQFLSPRAVAVNAKGEIYVLDSRQVQKLSPRGEWLASWGRPGSGDGEFRNAMGICIDAAGSVYVADTGNHRIQKFEPSGRLICSWGSNGKDSGLFDQPAGAVVDEGGIVYVVDRNNQRIQLFAAGAGALGSAEPQGGGPRAAPDRPSSRPMR